MYFFVNLLPTLFGRKVSLGYKYSINIFRKYELFTWLCLQMFTLSVNSLDNNTKKKKLQVTAENFVYTNLGGKKGNSVVFLSFIQ